MRCEEVADLLDDYVDGELSLDIAESVRGHLATCERCRDEESALGRLIDQTRRLPREIAPDRDLWPEVASRVKSDGAGRSYRHMFGPVFALAAAVAVVVSIGVLYEYQSAPAYPPVQPPPTMVSDAESDYLLVKEELLALLDSDQDLLSEETERAVRENLTVIERAVSELKTALADAPESAHLERMLAATYRAEADLLRQVMGAASIR